MAIPQLKGIKMLNFKNPFWRRYAKTGSKEITIEPGEIIIAGIVCIRNGMCTVRSKITGGALLVKPVKRRHGKKWSEFYHGFELNCIGINAPIIMIIPVPRSQDEFITDKIIGSDAQGNF
jgi:hypothetical protein